MSAVLQYVTEENHVKLFNCVTLTPSAGYYSWRNSKNGSWFIQALCKVFESDARKKQEIVAMLTKVNRKVAYEFQSNASREAMNRKKQIPSIVSMLTKQMFLSPK